MLPGEYAPYRIPTAFRTAPQTIQPSKDQAIHGTEGQSLRQMPALDVKLMTKDQDLSFQRGPGPEQTRLQASLIRQKHCAIRPHLPAELRFRQGQDEHALAGEAVLLRITETATPTSPIFELKRTRRFENNAAPRRLILLASQVPAFRQTRGPTQLIDTRADLKRTYPERAILRNSPKPVCDIACCNIAEHDRRS